MTTKECINIFNPWKQTLTEPEIEMFIEYSKFLSEDVNSALLTKDNFFIEPYLDKIKILDDALKRFKLPFSIEVFRADEENDILSANKIIETLEAVDEYYLEYPNFISTSFNRDVVLERIVCTSRNPNNVALLHNITLPENSNCGYLDRDLSYFPEEKEILIARGCFYIIDEVFLNQTYKNIVETKGWCDFEFEL